MSPYVIQVSGNHSPVVPIVSMTITKLAVCAVLTSNMSVRYDAKDGHKITTVRNSLGVPRQKNSSSVALCSMFSFQVGAHITSVMTSVMNAKGIRPRTHSDHTDATNASHHNPVLSRTKNCPPQLLIHSKNNNQIHQFTQRQNSI